MITDLNTKILKQIKDREIITIKELVNLNGITDKSVRAHIKKLLQQGYPIINNGGGYMYCNDKDTIKKYVKKLELNGKSYLERVYYLKKILENMENGENTKSKTED